MAIAVLAGRAIAHAIVQDCLQAIEVGAHNIHPTIRDKSCKVLPGSLPHDAGLVVVRMETLLDENGCDMQRESLDATLEWLVAGESKVVSGTGVPGTGGLRQAGQPAVEALRADICERRRCGRALWKVPNFVHPGILSQLHGGDVEGEMVPECAWNGVGAQTAE